MKVATWHGGTRFTLDEAPDPSPGPGEVIVEVGTVGICGTDVHITQGLFPATPPAVLGHEFGGEIVAVGEGVDGGRVGQTVVCDLSTHCMECVECRDGRSHRCVNGKKTTGGFAQFATVPEPSALPVPVGLDLELAALAEPASCCLSGMEMFEMPEGAVALVIGGGVMGLFSLAFARMRGAEVAILSDPIASRREMAMQLGADIVHDPASGDLREVVDEATNGRGVHVAIEAVGKPKLVARAIELSRPLGNVLMIGVSPQGSTLPYDLYDLQYREIAIRGAFGRGSVFKKTLELLPKLDLHGIISDRYPLSRVAEAITASAEGRGVKFAVRPNMPD